ncbi:MAG: FAD-dependent oxidoreductase, partial [Tepidimonas sp.]|nr:FAD-dependent oxidoreductase [Tepidimonas sp.]
MIRLAELKLPLQALPVETRRAADAPPETAADRVPPPHPIAALRALAAQALDVPANATTPFNVCKRAFDARGAQLRADYIVDVGLADPLQEAAALQRWAGHPHIQPTPDMTWQPPARAALE